jgi:hypothetical protein
MNRIQKVSGVFLIVFKFLLVFLPLCIALRWVMMNTELMQGPSFSFLSLFLMPIGKPYLLEAIWSPFTQFLGFCADMIGLLPILGGVYALIHIFKHYQNGEIFNAINARYYRLIGWMFIVDGLLTQLLSGSLLTVASTLNNIPGQRQISLAFGSPNIEAIFCGAVVIVISWVMLEASKLHEDQQYTV